MGILKQEEKAIVQELARKYRELAELPVNNERKKRMSDTNDLVTGLRPTVLINEIPWHELNFNGALTLQCETPFLRNMEWFFKSNLFRWEHFQADMVLEPFYAIGKSFTSTGNGLVTQEKIIKTDDSNHIVSHSYGDLLPDYDALEKMHMPVVTSDKELDMKNKEMAESILGTILPVKLKGTEIYFAPWDEIPRLHGVEAVLFDMVDRPEFLHAIIKKFAEGQMSYLTQLEEQDLLECELQTLHCTPAYTSQLPQKDFSGKTRLKDVWFRGMAQMFSSISPDMHEEFDLSYMRPLMERCGLVYYGCCEPLDNKIFMLKKIPNMRKIGVSPWANLDDCAEQLGSGYVYARKPNPAFVAMRFDPEVVRKETEAVVKACIKNNCPYEFVLKDISTVSYKPENLIQWNKVVQETIDKYYPRG